MYIIFQTRFEFPTDIDESEDCSNLAKDLMKRLICSPDARFGRGGVRDFMEHAWFKGIDWENIRESKLCIVLACTKQKQTKNTLLLKKHF